MKANRISAVVQTLPLLGALAFAPAARADDALPHKLGDHPAVVVQRLQKTAGYDYASKFYPHPAWLYLYGAAPGEETQYTATAQRASATKPSPMSSTVRADAAPAPRTSR